MSCSRSTSVHPARPSKLEANAKLIMGSGCLIGHWGNGYSIIMDRMLAHPRYLPGNNIECEIARALLVQTHLKRVNARLQKYSLLGTKH